MFGLRLPAIASLQHMTLQSGAAIAGLTRH
jgi:hypothetical protein